MSSIRITISSHKKSILISAIILGICLCCGIVLNATLRSNDTYNVYIYPHSSISTITSAISNRTDKCVLSTLLRLSAPSSIPPGHHQIITGDNLLRSTRKIISGQQTPIILTFNNTRTLNDLASKISAKLMLDSVQFVTFMMDSIKASEYNLTPHTFQSLFIPNTYSYYWTISMDELVKRMKKEYDRFWTPERNERLQRIGITAVEAITLASIVEEEARKESEQKLIAGVYLNRLRIGMPLQACPTAIYAAGDFTIRRVTSAITTIQSPYNTYNRTGLPIGPIRNPQPTTIDNVLQHTPSDYLYFCAKGDGSGTHYYARTFKEHSVNAILYQRKIFGKK